MQSLKKGRYKISPNHKVVLKTAFLILFCNLPENGLFLCADSVTESGRSIMQKKLIPFEKVSQLSKTDLAYISGDRTLMPFYKYELRHEVFTQIIADKRQANTPRDVLADVLQQQYARIPYADTARSIIELLRQPNTFTVTTAHQPSLFLGPMYFIYKAITTINLAEAIQGIVGLPYRIVPVFVLGSEDHDIDELNHIHLFNKTVRWNPGYEGPVGKIPTSTLRPALEELKAILGETENARYMYTRVERAYTNHATFGAATQVLLHELLGRYGLIVLDMNNRELKQEFLPIMRDELLTQTSQKLVTDTADQLNKLGFKTQATPREINLFYMGDHSRNRIVLENDRYKVLNTDLEFSQTEMLAELDQHPDRFSPNVVLRPLYQETILPNLAYVGGGGELAYWLERKSLFEHFKINYPVLVRRNSALWLDRDTSRRLNKFGFTVSQFFDDLDTLIKFYVEANATADVNLFSEITELRQIFERIANKANAIDSTLTAAVKADESRQVSNLEQWQNRLLRAEKQKHDVSLGQVKALKERLFPGGGLQERHDNFMQYYLRYGDRFFDIAKEKLLPLEQGFVVIEDI